MTTSGPARLLGDIGGTNARFAWQAGDGAPLQDIVALATADHASVGAAIAHYLAATGHSAPPWCAIGIANPITGDHVQMTNSHWSFSISALQAELGFERKPPAGSRQASAVPGPRSRAPAPGCHESQVVLEQRSRLAGRQRPGRPWVERAERRFRLVQGPGDAHCRSIPSSPVPARNTGIRPTGSRIQGPTRCWPDTVCLTVRE